jgi:hypothetical protein
MVTSEMDLAEKKLDRLAGLSLYHQSFWLFLLSALLFFKPQHYKDAAQCLGFAALISSFIASRIYIYAGKKVEEFKRFSAEEAEDRKKEYMIRFFLPYFVWAGCIAVFSY